MKIRTNYVSNSSSSSFILIGKKICKLNESSKDIKLDRNKTYVAIGKFLNEGYDVAEFNQEMFDYVIAHIDSSNYQDFYSNTLYESISSNEYETSIKYEDLKKHFKSDNELVYAIHVDADYGSSMNLEDLKKNYE